MIMLSLTVVIPDPASLPYAYVVAGVATLVLEAPDYRGRVVGSTGVAERVRVPSATLLSQWCWQ